MRGISLLSTVGWGCDRPRLSCNQCVNNGERENTEGLLRTCLRGRDLGVDVKMGYLSGRRSGEVELSVGEVCGGERWIGCNDVARGGRADG